jgi:hypothetical protein
VKVGQLVETVQFDDHGVGEAYRNARRPQAREEDVKPLNLKPEEVRRLAEQAGLLG